MFILRVSYANTTQWPKGMVFRLHPAIQIFSQNVLVWSFCLCRSEHSSLRKPWNIPNLPSALLFRQAIRATSCHQSTAGGSRDRTECDRQGRGTRLLQSDRCCGPVAAVKFQEPCWNQSAPEDFLQPRWWDTDRTNGWHSGWKSGWALRLEGSALPQVEKATGDWCHSDTRANTV